MRADNSFAFAFNKIAPPESSSPEALRAYNSKVNRAFEEIYEKVYGYVDIKNLSLQARKEINNKVESEALDKYTLLTQTEDMIALEAARVDGNMSALTVRADGIEAKAVAADGKAAQAQLTADGASTTASNAAGIASEAKQTAEAFSWRLKSQSGSQEARITSPDNYTVQLSLYSGDGYGVTSYINSGAYESGMTIHSNASVCLETNVGDSLLLYNGRSEFSTHLMPNSGAVGLATVGDASSRWKKAYWVESASVSSDLRLKQNIVPLGEMDDEAGLLYRLKPIRYRLKSDAKKLHFGFGAQHVQEAIKGTSYEDAALLADEDPDHLGLCYEELIAVLVAGHQKQQARIDVLEARLAALEGMNDDRR